MSVCRNCNKAINPNDTEICNNCRLDSSPTSKKLIQLAQGIILAVSEGKTVNAANKKLIKEAADDIITLCKTSPPTSPTSNTEEQKLTELKEELIAEIHSTIRDSFKELNTSLLLTSTATNTTYASVTKTHQPRKPALIIEPNPNAPSSSPTTSTNSTLDQLKNKITFKDKDYAPTKIQPITKGRVYIEFDTEQQRKETLQIINQTNTLKAEEAKRRPPLAIVKGIHKETNRDELKNIICQQNSIPTTDIRICFLTSNRSAKLYNAVVELAPTSYHKLITQERIAINFQQVHIEPFSRFIQCRKCLQFGHSHNKCIATVHPCAICAATIHPSAECPRKAAKQYECYNCSRHNARTGAKLPTNHAANNQSACPRICLAKEKIEETIDYGTTKFSPLTQPEANNVITPPN